MGWGDAWPLMGFTTDDCRIGRPLLLHDDR
jgi:hypothetical protein